MLCVCVCVWVCIYRVNKLVLAGWPTLSVEVLHYLRSGHFSDSPTFLFAKLKSSLLSSHYAVVIKAALSLLQIAANCWEVVLSRNIYCLSIHCITIQPTHQSSMFIYKTIRWLLGAKVLKRIKEDFSQTLRKIFQQGWNSFNYFSNLP